MPVIYIDVLFMLNLWVDFLLLSATARLCRLPVKRFRLVLGAVIGAGGSLLLFLPPLSFFVALGVRIGGTVLLTLVTFSYHSRQRFLRTVFCFLILNSLFAGLATALWYMAAPAGYVTVHGVIYYDAPASLLVLFTGISYAALCIFERILQKRAPKNRTLTLSLEHGGKTLVCTCLYDSGSTLREPFSGKPAVLIDRTAAQRILPPQIDTPESFHGRWIPYKSLGGEGALPAFQPTRMEISDKNGRRVDISGSYLAICDAMGRGEYTALVGTDIGDLIAEGSR